MMLVISIWLIVAVIGVTGLCGVIVFTRDNH
jgi:hypothetical protein